MYGHGGWIDTLVSAMITSIKAARRFCMPTTATRSSWDKWRLPILVATIVVIVVVPYMLLRASTQRTLDAANWVIRTREIEAAVHALTYDARDIEAAAQSIALGIDTPMVRAGMDESMAQLPLALADVIRLTRHNPDQLLRIGVLKANLLERNQIALRIARAGESERLRQNVEALVTRFPIRGLATEIVDEEKRLLARRKIEAERLRNQTLGLTLSAMFAQLVLLGLVTFFSQRQIGRRLQAEREGLRASERAEAVLQTVREPIVLTDGQQRVVMHNAAFAELYSVGKESVVGTSLAELGKGAWQDSEMLQRLRDVLSRGRELWDFEQVQHTVDGVERTISINARQMPLPDRDDKVVLITVADITARKAGEARILELNRQLEGKVHQVSDVNRELEAFSYSVSHDLRAPLRHIAGFADKLGKQLGDDADEKSRHYLGVIGDSAKRMSTLIDDLLVYSQLGRSAMRLRALDMQTMVAETRAMLDANAHADAPGRRIEWRIGTLPILVADENMLRQVWQNLLGNAVKYSARSDPAIIGITHAFDDDGSHHFTVQDNGAGFDMAYAGKLFGVFQRLHKASDYPGTGIGLASVRRALMRHGGSIRAEASLDEGATFHFTLPATLSSPTANRETHA